jgi:Uncharacterized protein conserved in bacteria (DUF2252)
VGIGSVETRCWVMLLLGRDANDPLFLQINEAEASVLEPVLGAGRSAKHGRRVVDGQRLTQAASDIFLGWIHSDEEVDGGAHDFLRPPALGLEGLRRRRDDPAERPRQLRAGMRLDAGARARSVRRPDCDRGLPRQER